MTEPRTETDVLRAKLDDHRELVRHLNEVLSRKNRELDAFHYVWCDGGCAADARRAFTGTARANSPRRSSSPPNIRLHDFDAGGRTPTPQGDPMPESVFLPIPADIATWMRCYGTSIERFELVCMAVFTAVADRGSLAELVDFVADVMNGCDVVDEESIALYERAKQAAVEIDREGRLRR